MQSLSQIRPMSPALSALAFLILPFILLYTNALAAYSPPAIANMFHGEGRLDSETLSIAGLISFIASLFVAAKVRITPHVSTAAGISIMLVPFFTGSRSPYGIAYFFFWIVLIGAGLAWNGSKYFSRPFHPLWFFVWALSGMRNIIRPGVWALVRVVAGLAIITLMPLTSFYPEIRRVFIVPGLTPRLQPAAAPMLLGTFLLVSGLNIPAEEDPDRGNNP